MVLVPLWAWSSVVLFFGWQADGAGGPFGVGLAAAFFALAMVSGPIAGRLSQSLVVSHLLGAGLLLSVAFVAWLGGPMLLVALAGQAVATLVIGRRLDDELLRINGYALAGVVWLLLVGALADIIDSSSLTFGEAAANGLVVAALWAVAVLIGRDLPGHGPGAPGVARDGAGIGNVVELVFAVAWVATIGYLASLVAPVVSGQGWLAIGAVLSAATVLAASRLGSMVFVVGAVLSVATVAGTAGNLLITAIDGNHLGGHLANLTVVALLVLGTGWAWIVERRTTLARGLLVVAWVMTLGWAAALFLAELDASQSQVAISVVWAAAAVVAIVAAIRTDESVVRVIGLATLGVVLVKLLTVDLAEVDTLWRVGLFLVIGLGLLRLGYVLPALAERYGPPATAAPVGGGGTADHRPARSPKVDRRPRH